MDPTARILIVEDEAKISEPLASSLEAEGYTCTVAEDGPSGLAKARAENPDLVILDLMLPGMDGLSVCRQLRKDSEVPILMLTARDGEADQVLGFEVGADDYVTKPFSLAVLRSRVRSLLRRSRGGAEGEDDSPPVHQFGDLVIDEGRHEVTVAGKAVELTSTEFSLLAFLAARPGRALTREQLLESVWGYTFEGYRRTVDSHITRIRKKIEAEPSNPEYIHTVYKVGYKFREAE